jgi:hypothetical protein
MPWPEGFEEEPVGTLADVASELRRGSLGPTDAIARLRILTVFADAADLARIACLMGDLRKDIATTSSAAVEQGAQMKAVSVLAGLPMGGQLSTTWRAARRLTNFTLHLIGPETSHTVKWDSSTGAQVADIPATTAVSDPWVFMCVFLHFRHAASVASLLSEDDLHELGAFVTERLYTGSKTEAIECTVRKLLYTLDVDSTGTMALASLVMTRGPMELQAEEGRCMYVAQAARGRTTLMDEYTPSAVAYSSSDDAGEDSADGPSEDSSDEESIEPFEGA